MRRIAIALATLMPTLIACESVLGIDTGRHLADAGAQRCTGTIHVRVAYDMTGPTRDVSTAGGKGTYDRLRDLNDAGGIRGCMLDIDVEDSQYDPQTTLAVYDAWRARADWPSVSTIFVQGTPVTEALASRAGDEQKLVVTGSYAGELASPLAVSHDIGVPSLNASFVEAVVPATKTAPGYPFVFFQGTDYTTSARIAMRQAWEQGAKRVGFHYCSTSAFCVDPVDGAKTFLVQLGGTRVGRDLSIELTDTDAQVDAKVFAYFQQELDHQSSDPTYSPVDWVWFGNTRASLASFGKALDHVASALGLRVAVITNTYALDEDLYGACGAPCVGFLGVRSFQTWSDPQAAGMQDVMRVHAKYRAIDGESDTAYRNVDYVGGYVMAETWKLAVEAVVDSGLPVTGSNLKDALERFRGQSVAGFATPSYSSTDHRPQGTARIYRLESSGELATVGQPLTIPLSQEWLGW